MVADGSVQAGWWGEGVKHVIFPTDIVAYVCRCVCPNRLVGQRGDCQAAASNELKWGSSCIDC